MLLLVFDVLQLHADVTQGVRSESSRQRQIINERIETHMRWSYWRTRCQTRSWWSWRGAQTKILSRQCQTRAESSLLKLIIIFDLKLERPEIICYAANVGHLWVLNAKIAFSCGCVSSLRSFEKNFKGLGTYFWKCVLDIFVPLMKRAGLEEHLIGRSWPAAPLQLNELNYLTPVVKF